MKWDIDSVRFLTSISMKWEEIANLFGVSTHKKVCAILAWMCYAVVAQGML